MRGAARGPTLSLCVILVSLLASAGAEAAGKRIGVPKFEGTQEALVRKKVMEALKAHGFELVRSRDMQDAISSTGASLDTDDGLKTLAKELALAAIVTGEVGPKRAKIVIHDGGEGSILGDASFFGPNPRKLATEVGLNFWKKLGPDVGRGHVPAGAKKGQKASEASPEDEEGAPEGGAAEAAPPKPKDDSASAEGEGGASDEAAAAKKKKKKPKMEEAPEEASAPAVPSGYPWLDFELGIGGLNRNLSYNQNIQIGNPPMGTLLRPYSLGSGPMLTANVVMYPLDPWVGGALGNIGLETEIQQGFAISSGSYSNVVHDYAGGGRYRIPFGGTNQFYISATGGEDAFTFTGANRGSLAVPDTIYHYFRPGVGVKMFVVDGFSLALSGGYRVVLNGAGPQLSGSPNGLFPHLTVAGADAEVVAGLRLSDMFEVRAGVEWKRYWFNMHSVATDNNFAGGAVDQSFVFTARIAILLGGTSGVTKSEGGPGSEEAPPPPPPSKNRGRKGSSDGDESSGGDSDTGSPSVESGGHKSGGDTDE